MTLAAVHPDRMTTFVSMLRGINVSGQKKVPMEELAAVYASLGFGRVRTYIQSGNVLFESSSNDSSGLAGVIERGIRSHFGFDASVIIRTGGGDLRRVIRDNPFAGKDETKVHVTFMSSEPSEPGTDEIFRAKGRSEQISIQRREVYLFCPDGYGISKLSNAFLERKLNVIATTRNWRTANALASMTELKS